MKRSEVLYVLERAIDISINSGTSPKSIAKDVLDIVEHMGMLPPCVEGAAHYDDDNYWEPEDE